MSVDDQERRAIVFLALRIRRQTHGCAPWDEHGLAANLAKLADRNLHMTIEHVLRHAADPAAKTPGVILGSFTPEAPKAQRARPPKRAEECQTHAGQFADNCGGCRADQLAGDKPLRRRRDASGVDVAAAAQACREAMREEAS